VDVAVNKIRIVVVDKASGVLPLGWFPCVSCPFRSTSGGLRLAHSTAQCVLEPYRPAV